VNRLTDTTKKNAANRIQNLWPDVAEGDKIEVETGFKLDPGSSKISAEVIDVSDWKAGSRIAFKREGYKHVILEFENRGAFSVTIIDDSEVSE